MLALSLSITRIDLMCRNKQRQMESQLDRNRPEVAEGLNRLSQRNLSPTLDYNLYLKLREAYYGQEEEDS